MQIDRHKSSYRDPDGFVFSDNGQIRRAIHPRYQKTYDQFVQSGFYAKLQKAGLLIPHSEIANLVDGHKVIVPERVDVISYPYEWSFGQLKDAALATLEIQRVALESGVTLKDASAYNIQFHRGRAVMIDTLSFEVWNGEPWHAYKQFCEHFLAPLALMAKVDLGFGMMLVPNLEGVPLELTSSALPWSTRFTFGLWLHIHMHAKSLKAKGSGQLKAAGHRRKVHKASVLGLISSLKSAVEKLAPKGQATYWGDYYQATNYSDAAMKVKRELISAWVAELKPKHVWDLGANDGSFSELAAKVAESVLSLDIDPKAVDSNYAKVKKNQTKNILPLIFNVANPSPDIGWRNRERTRLEDRARPQVLMALALIHHLVFTHNIPLEEVASYLAHLTEYLIIEFVPRSDSQVVEMLALKADTYEYSEKSFETAFGQYFELQESQLIEGSLRRLYRFKRRANV